MKYVVFAGYEGRYKFESNSRNARRHIINGGYDRVRIETKSGKFVCEGIRYTDCIVVTTIADINERKRS